MTTNMMRHPGGMARMALHTTLLLLPVVTAACGGDAAKAPAAAAAAPAPVAPRDTAWLDAASLGVGGFTTTAVERVAWRDAWQLPGRLVLDPTQTQPLGSIVEGRVTAVFVQAGDRVRRGQILVTIHSHELTDARNALAQARAGRAEADNASQLAATAAARSERLFAARAGSQADLERARAALAAAQEGQRRAASEYSRASEMVDHLHPAGPSRSGVDPEDVIVRAPFDGVVMDRHAEPGSVVLPGAPLVTVSKAAALLLELRVPEAALSAAKVGSAVQFGVPAFPGRAFTARITRVSPVLDSLTRTAEVFAAVDSRSGELRAAMSAAAELFGLARDSVLAVPAAAVQDFEGDTVVVTGVKRSGGMLLEAMRVRVGRRAGGMAEVRSGIAAGALVIGEGASIARAEILRQRDARAAEGAPE
ncbi:MAG: efflux RND transporter periplasmic adaptor subunit [Gemmatimonadaceae bacterium]|nr:efflux RND transporter periplasmic adaptor subunit [Gemmatimonadaceae bacterium]